MSDLGPRGLLAYACLLLFVCICVIVVAIP